MNKKLLIGIGILGIMCILLMSGCITEKETKYVCSDGATVSDPSLCPKEKQCKEVQLPPYGASEEVVTRKGYENELFNGNITLKSEYNARYEHYFMSADKELTLSRIPDVFEGVSLLGYFESCCNVSFVIHNGGCSPNGGGPGGAIVFDDRGVNSGTFNFTLPQGVSDRICIRIEFEPVSTELKFDVMVRVVEKVKPKIERQWIPKNITEIQCD